MVITRYLSFEWQMIWRLKRGSEPETKSERFSKKKKQSPRFKCVNVCVFSLWTGYTWKQKVHRRTSDWYANGPEQWL